MGDLVHQLVEDGKAYARAEVDVVKATATAKVRALAVPAALIGAASLLAIASFGALVLGVFHVLDPHVGPLGAGVITFLLFMGLAGGLFYLGMAKARKAL
ncbi:MAG: phage holin family protein [Sphingomicrobium sp.]